MTVSPIPGIREPHSLVERRVVAASGRAARVAELDNVAPAKEARHLSIPHAPPRGLPSCRGNGPIRGPAGQGTESGIAFFFLKPFDVRTRIPSVSINACRGRELGVRNDAKRNSPERRWGHCTGRAGARVASEHQRPAKSVECEGHFGWIAADSGTATGRPG